MTLLEGKVSSIKQQVADLQFNVDRLDGNMKRKNLRIQGVPGQVREPRSVTERKAREILEHDLKCDYVTIVRFCKQCIFEFKHSTLINTFTIANNIVISCRYK